MSLGDEISPTMPDVGPELAAGAARMTAYLERHPRVADLLGTLVLTGPLWAPAVVAWWS